MIRKFFLFFFVGIALIFEAYFSLSGLAFFVLEILLFSLVLAVFLRIFDRYKAVPFRQFFLQIFVSFCAFFGVLVSLFFGFIFWHNTFPGEIADVTLSSQTHSGKVLFVQMSHIATPSFYAEKQKSFASLSNSGYIFLVEGVRGGSKESQERFNAHLGVDFTATLYDSIASIIGLEAQDNKKLFSLVDSDQIRSVDVSIDDIAKLLPTQTGASQTGKTLEVVDIEAEIARYTQEANPREKRLLQFVARGVLNASLKSSEDVLSFLEGGDKAVLMQILLDERNKRIIDYIVSHPNENIVVVYGALHFNGVFEALQKLSSPWKIDSIQTYFPYKK